MTIGINMSDDHMYEGEYITGDEFKLKEAKILLKLCRKNLNKKLRLSERIELRQKINKFLGDGCS